MALRDQFGGNEAQRYSTCGGHLDPSKIQASPKKSYSTDIGVIFGTEILEDNSPTDPSELCSFLQAKKLFFANVLTHHDIFKDKFVSIWSLIASCCQCVEAKQLHAILRTVNEAEEFILNGLLKFLVKVTKDNNKEDEMKVLCDVTFYLEKLIEHFPTLSLPSLSLILPFLRDAVKANISLLGRELLDRIERLEAKKMDLKSGRDAKVKWSNIDDVEVNFRKLPVLPDVNEVLNGEEAFFISQVTEGRFRDIEQYLNYHFRVIRGELIRLVRQKISIYKDYVHNGNEELLHEISSHTNVRVTNILVSEDGVLHEVQFLYDSFLNYIPWEYSKHFTAGSLLCLSSDDFQTVHFGIVVGHDPILLKQQKLYVRFGPQAIMGASSSDETRYVAIEVNINCDTCFPILSNLQKVPNSFPLAKCLVNLQNQFETPTYASDKSLKYCFETVFTKHTETNNVNNKEIQSAEACCCASEKIQIHNREHWVGLDLGLDESQKTALRTSLTRGLTVIQGIPGTGKTQVASKLVQILLHNRFAWQKANVSCPIVILTHTSSCLDKFLIRLLHITSKIIRIGGQSKNELLSKYNLKRQESVPSDWQSQAKSKREIGGKLVKLSRQILDIENKNRKSKCDILSVEDLRKSIAQNDLERLEVNCPVQHSSSDDLDTLLRKWLDVDSLLSKLYERVPVSTFKDDSCFTQYNYKPAEREIDYMKFVQDANSIHEECSIDGEFRDLKALFVQDGKVSMNNQPVDSDRWKIENIIRKLNVVPMTPAQSAFCTDLWNLALEDRWSLYCLWLKKYNEHKAKQMEEYRQEYEIELSKLKMVTETRQSQALNEAQVIGLTVNGAAKYGNAVRSLKPKIIIVEEAEKILDSQILLLLNEETEQLILIGDQKASTSLGTLFGSKKTSDVLTSFFQRLVKSGVPYCRLDTQYNTRPAISQLLISEYFHEGTVHALNREDQNISGLEKNMFFFTHSVVETRSKDGANYINDHEVNFIVELCRYILLQGYPSSSIVILTPYLAQFYVFRKRMVGHLQGVKVSLPYNFQDDSDIILASFVRSESESVSTTSIEDELLYTALSRAKSGLFLVGNFEGLAKKSSIWRNLCERLREKKYLGSEINIMCQAHGKVVSVKSHRDMIRLGDGGCGEPCKYRMACGHECPRKCHPNDRAHDNAICMEPCQAVLCSNNHKCSKLCWEKCGNCSAMLDNVVLRCGHSTQAPCFRLSNDKNSYWAVPYKVGDSLHGKEEIKLSFAVKFSIDSNNSLCYPSLDQECKEECGKELECGHVCKGKCGECLGGRIHVPCLEVCGKVQLCGHKCLYPCCSPCPPCSFQYENTCSHTRWTVFCGFPTSPCLEPCTWSCEHLSCSNMCHEPCNRPPCNEPCKRILGCGHFCIGMCGEPCPDKCRHCNHVEVTSVFFGHEQNPLARFIQLVDCGHLFEVAGLTFWITNEFQNKPVVDLIKCPICYKPILKSRRFGNLIKQRMKITEVLKKKKYQKMCDVSEVKCLLSEIKKQLIVLSERNMTNERFWTEDQSCTDPCSILEALYGRLYPKYNPIDEGMLALFYNYYTFARENFKIAMKMEKLQETEYPPLAGNAVRRTCNFVGNTLDAINERVLYFWEFGSAQFIEEIVSELRRLHLACNFVSTCKIFFDLGNEYVNGKLEEALNLVLRDVTFRAQEEWVFSLILRELQNLFPDSTVLKIIEEPRIPVVKAMELAEGNHSWSEMAAE